VPSTIKYCESTEITADTIAGDGFCADVVADASPRPIATHTHQRCTDFIMTSPNGCWAFPRVKNRLRNARHLCGGVTVTSQARS
jgi:hypothetical protein